MYGAFSKTISTLLANFYFITKIAKNEQVQEISKFSMKADFTIETKLAVILLIISTDCIYGQMLPLPVRNKCPDVCPTCYRVVCALHNGCLRTFASSCVMRMYNCKYQKDYRIISQRACEVISNEELLQMEL